MLVWKACMEEKKEKGEGRKEVFRIKTIPKTKNLQVFFRLAGFIKIIFLTKFFITSNANTSGYSLLKNLENIISKSKDH